MSKTHNNHFRGKFSIFKQFFELIERNLCNKIKNKHNVQTRSITVNCHLAALMLGQFLRAFSLQEICDCMKLHSGQLNQIRKIKAMSKNGLSYANRTRNSDMAVDTFWAVFESLNRRTPSFGLGKKLRPKTPRRFKRLINIIDSTLINVSLSSIQWASYRKNKAAIKLHTRIDADSFLPAFMILEKGKHNDKIYAQELCKDLKKGEIVMFDRAYNDFDFLADLDQRGINWVGRLKSNVTYDVMEKKSLSDKEEKAGIKSICTIRLIGSYDKYPIEIRMVEAELEVRKEKKVIQFISNNMKWAASSITELYKSRWAIEEFFKELKQTLQIKSFYGENKNAIIWQVYSALLVYLLTRYLSHIHNWASGIPRLFAILKCALFKNADLESLIKSYGTAKVPNSSDPPDILRQLDLFDQFYGTAKKDMSRLPI